MPELACHDGEWLSAVAGKAHWLLTFVSHAVSSLGIWVVRAFPLRLRLPLLFLLLLCRRMFFLSLLFPTKVCIEERVLVELSNLGAQIRRCMHRGMQE